MAKQETGNRLPSCLLQPLSSVECVVRGFCATGNHANYSRAKTRLEINADGGTNE
jgi:hypothetical protein